MSLLTRFQDTLREQGPLATLQRVGTSLASRAHHFLWVPLAHTFGIPTPLNLPDRTFLEQNIFGWLNDEPAIHTILFAGVESYTWHYYKLLVGKTVFTIDSLPKQAKWGRKGYHTTGSVTQLSRHYKPQQFDLIIYNGLIGWGLNATADVNLALTQAYEMLAPGGMLIIGWDNDPKFISFPLEELEGYKLFRHHTPLGMGLSGYRYEASPWRRHTFDFLIKPGTKTASS